MQNVIIFIHIISPIEQGKNKKNPRLPHMANSKILTAIKRENTKESNMNCDINEFNKRTTIFFMLFTIKYWFDA